MAKVALDASVFALEKQTEDYPLSALALLFSFLHTAN